MPATVTLSTTTLANPCGAADRQIRLASTSGLAPGTQLFFDGELVEVVSLEVDSWVEVLRGRQGSLAEHHDSAATVYIGRADQFFANDPKGAPPEAIPVSPHINVRNGSVWFAQGDAIEGGKGKRWWTKQETTFDRGALGVRTEVLSPTSST